MLLPEKGIESWKQKQKVKVKVKKRTNQPNKTKQSKTENEKVTDSEGVQKGKLLNREIPALQ